jgi:hypothetical protein
VYRNEVLQMLQNSLRLDALLLEVLLHSPEKTTLYRKYLLDSATPPLIATIKKSHCFFSNPDLAIHE